MSLKNWIVMKGITGKLPDWAYRLIGRKISKTLHLEDKEMETKKWYLSKAKLAAIVTVIVGAVGPISSAFGHPIAVPDFVIQVLIGLGIYGVRDAIKS